MFHFEAKLDPYHTFLQIFKKLTSKAVSVLSRLICSIFLEIGYCDIFPSNAFLSLFNNFSVSKYVSFRFVFVSDFLFVHMISNFFVLMSPDFSIKFNFFSKF